MKQYYYADETNNAVGPLTADALLELHRTGTIKSTTLVTEESPENWIPLYEHKLVDLSKSEVAPAAAVTPPIKSTPPPLNPEMSPPVTRAAYTEDDAKRIAFELSESSGWSYFFGFIGAICILGIVIVFGVSSDTRDGVNIPLIIYLLTSSLSCFFAAYLVNRFKDIHIFQRELYHIEMRRELNKTIKNEK